MRFFSKKICEKLVALGCISDSGNFYLIFCDADGSELWGIPEPKPRIFDERNERLVPAFSISDFLETTEQAKKNCLKIIGVKKFDLKREDPGIASTILSARDKFRYKILDSDDAIKFISEHVEGL